MWLLGFVTVLPLTHAAHVYLNGIENRFSSALSLEDASSLISHHLGLDIFEPMTVGVPLDFASSFLGQGTTNSLLVLLDESHTDSLPPHLYHRLHVPSLSGGNTYMTSTYTTRAKHLYPWVLESTDVDEVASFFRRTPDPSFATLKISAHNPDHEDSSYTAQTLYELFETKPEELRVVIVVRASSLAGSHSRRQLQSRPPPQLPLGAVSTCYGTIDSCNNRTSSCSGRGWCVAASKAGKTCFVCTCGVTQSGQGNQIKTEKWAGESCERKDVSGPFALLAGTTLTMMFIVIGSISLLYSVGQIELPSTLMGTAVGPRKE